MLSGERNQESAARAVGFVKVLHVSTVHSPADTRILYRECTSLASHGYAVTLVACGDVPAKVGPVRVLTFPRPKTRFHRFTISAFRVIRAAWREDAGIYHFHDPELAPWMLLLRARGKPVIFDIHENIVGSLASRTWIPKALRKHTGILAQAVVVFTSRWYHVVFAERSYPAVYPGIERFRIVCNFPDLSQFSVASAEEKFARFSVVYVGGLTRARGMLDMLETMRVLQESNVPVDLYLIGRLDEPDIGDPAQLISEKSLTNVKYFGYLAQPDAMSIVRKCHVGLAVLHSTDNYKLSFPTKMFEYMACGLAVISSDASLYRSVIDRWKCGIAIRPADPELLAATVEMLAGNGSAAHQMGVNGRRAVEQEYNWSSQSEELFALYDSIVEAMPAPT